MSKAKLPVRRLGDVCRVQKGKVITEKETTAGQVPVVAGGSKPAYFHNVSNRDPGTITISASGYAGFVSYWSVPIWASDCITVEPLDPTAADSPYLFHALKYLEPSVLRSLQRGAAQKHVYAKDIQEIELPIPTIDEQRRIASILDAADALRTKRRQAIEKVGNLAQSIFVDMFVDNADEAWPQATIEALAASSPGSIRTGPFGSQLLHEEFVEDGPVAVLGIDNVVTNDFRWGQRRFITEEKYGALKRYTVHPGDVLVTIMGTTGRVAVVPDDVPRSINTKHLCCVTLNPDVCLPWFMWACLRFHPDVLQQLGATRGAVMPGLNMGLIKSALLPVPPLTEQQIFVDRITKTQALQMNVLGHLVEIDHLFASLQNRAFRGAL